MASNNSKKIGVDLDMSSGAKLKNLTASTVSGEAVEHSELNTKLALKQDNVTGGSGINVDGTEITVDLATAGSDYDSLTLSGLSYASLNGEYTRLPYSAELENVGINLDLTIGDLDIDWNAYYKDNGSGIWAVCIKRDNDGDQETSPTSNAWMTVLTTTDPTSFSYTGSGTSVVSSYIPDYSAVDYASPTYSNESSGDGKFSPASIDSNVSYGTGSTPAGLLFDNNKLAIDFANTTAQASSTKVFPSSVIKTYTDEQIVLAKDLANHPFSNTIAQLTGNPNNAQSAIESCAGEINTIDGQVSALQTTDAVHTSHIASHSSALGVSNGDNAMPVVTGAASAFVTGSTVAARQQAIGDSIGGVYSNMGGLLGLGQFDTDFGDGFVILPNDSDAKALFQATEAELQNISLGLGQFWSPVEAHADSNVDITNPGTDTFEGAVVTVGQRVLLIAQTDASENGIYVFATSSTALVRSLDANEDAEFSPNKTVQVLSSSEEGISGATFSYTGSDDPVIGTDDLTFELKAKGVVGDNTITESKLGVAVALKLNNKTDKYAETVTLTAGTPVNITHGLNSQDVIVQVRDTSGNVTDVEIDITDSSYATINTLYSGDYRVVVVG